MTSNNEPKTVPYKKPRLKTLEKHVQNKPRSSVGTDVSGFITVQCLESVVRRVLLSQLLLS